MVKHTHTIRQQFADKLFVFDHFVKLALKRLIFSRSKKTNSFTCTTFYVRFSKNIFWKILTTLKLEQQDNNPSVDVPLHPKHFDLLHFESTLERHEYHP